MQTAHEPNRIPTQHKHQPPHALLWRRRRRGVQPQPASRGCLGAALGSYLCSTGPSARAQGQRIARAAAAKCKARDRCLLASGWAHTHRCTHGTHMRTRGAHIWYAHMAHTHTRTHTGYTLLSRLPKLGGGEGCSRRHAGLHVHWFTAFGCFSTEVDGMQHAEHTKTRTCVPRHPQAGESYSISSEPSQCRPGNWQHALRRGPLAQSACRLPVAPHCGHCWSSSPRSPLASFARVPQVEGLYGAFRPRVR